ncbi:MAG TPA: hypothetical protein VNF72_07135 [Myxococcota bacterium]|nr:hypothetical protein [Myxococcota bacterium]
MPAACIFAVSLGLLIDEIMLSAIFNVLLGAGNTVAAISIALIGLSASGVVAYLVPALHVPSRAATLFPKLLFAFSLSLVAGMLLIMRIPIGHGDLAYSGSGLAVQLWGLAVYQIALVPFFLGGLTLAVLFRSHPQHISRLYFADLSGAAAGCALSPLLLSAVGAPAAIVVGALPAALLAGVVGLRARALRPGLLLLFAVALVLAWRPELRSFATLNTLGDVRAPAFRSFPIGPGDIDFEAWALDAWTIVRSERIPQQWEDFEGWGLSPRFDGAVPRLRLVNYNARFSTYVTEFDGDTGPIGDWLDADLISLHHRLGRSYESVLNIGAGGGREVLNALHHGAKQVVAVDVSDVVVNDIMKGHLREFSGDLYLDPRVRAVADEGRSFTERAREPFDLVDFSIVGGTNLEKMELVRVDDLFTLEALRVYADRLTRGGVFSYVMYSTRSDLVDGIAESGQLLAQPYIPALRTLAGLRLVLAERDPAARFADHVLVAALPGVIDPSYDLVHIIVSRSPFTGAERAEFLRLCAEQGFEVLFPRADGLYARVVEEDLATLARGLPFSIWPATDDRPFQYGIDWDHLRRAASQGQLLPLLAGNPLVSLGAGIGLVGALVTLLPLVLLRARGGEGLVALRRGGGLLLLVYFACIGFAYMAVEIAALLRLQSYLGKPIYGLSVGLFAFLFASGLGSQLTGKLDPARLTRSACVAVACVVAAGAAFLWVSAPLFAGTLAWTLPARIAVAVAAIAPVALPMGMLFPIGVKLIAQSNPDLIPWAWATNGCFSVFGIFGTRITALFIGFSRAFLVGLLVYALVAGIALWHARRPT